MNERAVIKLEMPDGVKQVAMRRPILQRISTRILLLTIFFIIIVNILILVPSTSYYRLQWLQERLSVAESLSVALQNEPTVFSRLNNNEFLNAFGIRAISTQDSSVSMHLTDSNTPTEVDEHIDLANIGPVDAIVGALNTVFFGGDRIMRVFCNPPGSSSNFELIYPDWKLRKVMLVHVGSIVPLTVVASILAGILVFVVVNRIMVEPIRGLRQSLLSFAEVPEDPARILKPSGRRDELGAAEKELAELELRLQTTLSKQRHLADLGLAVSKINHDIRNILASVRLHSDRLVLVKDPTVQAFAPKLVRALDRAVGYSEGVVAYGRSQESQPKRETFRLRQLVHEVYDGLAIDPASAIQFKNLVEEEFELNADPEHLFRVLVNLCRNAVEVMSSNHDAVVEPRLTVSAERTGDTCRILVTDTGPGVPQKARENLFKPFRGSTRSGGTGLGLAIAYELACAHGGAVELVESSSGYTVFAVVISNQPAPEADAL